jgi:hypothetical protein
MYVVFQKIIVQFMRRNPVIPMKITIAGEIKETRRKRNEEIGRITGENINMIADPAKTD